MTHTTLAEEYQRGKLFFDAQDYAGAARILAGVVTQEPRHLSVRLLLARAYYHSAQLGRAETELRQVLAQDPVEPYAHLLLARTLERQNQRDEAGVHRRQTVALTGHDTTAA